MFAQWKQVCLIQCRNGSKIVPFALNYHDKNILFQVLYSFEYLYICLLIYRYWRTWSKKVLNNTLPNCWRFVLTMLCIHSTISAVNVGGPTLQELLLLKQILAPLNRIVFTYYCLEHNSTFRPIMSTHTIPPLPPLSP